MPIIYWFEIKASWYYYRAEMRTAIPKIADHVSWLKTPNRQKDNEITDRQTEGDVIANMLQCGDQTTSNRSIITKSNGKLCSVEWYQARCSVTVRLPRFSDRTRNCLPTFKLQANNSRNVVDDTNSTTYRRISRIGYTLCIAKSNCRWSSLTSCHAKQIL